MDLDCHIMSGKFESITDLKMKLIDCWPEYIGPTTNFQLGYLEGHGNQKRWIVRLEDLKNMYDNCEEGAKIKLWCEAKEKETDKENCKRKNEDKGVDEQLSKRKETTLLKQIFVFNAKKSMMMNILHLNTTCRLN